jgi:hypothetical protein
MGVKANKDEELRKECDITERLSRQDIERDKNRAGADAFDAVPFMPRNIPGPGTDRRRGRRAAR